MKLVIVGGVAAGMSTAARARRLDHTAEIVVLERDRYVSFANCGLPYHIGGEIPDRDVLLLQTPESLAASMDLDVRIGHEVLRIDPEAKFVEIREVESGKTYEERYDKLVLCPGAEPLRPPIEGADNPRIDVLRNIPDMDRIIERLDAGAESAIVIGGSYIGLELVEAFRTRGLRTTVVEREQGLMPWLDPEMTRILHFHVNTHDVDVRLGTSAKAIREDGDQFVVELSDGDSARADLVVLAAGVRPNVALARDTGLAIGPRGGIVVDEHMRTSDSDILAAGDAVETPHFITGEPDLEHLELGYAPPYGSAKDPVNMIGFQASNLLRGDIDLWYPEDYPECADRVMLLDVRTPAEYEHWHIPEAVNIPYTELRSRLDEVPRDRPVFTYCRSGFRSYISYYDLKHRGYETAFLSGGMITFHGFHRTPLRVGEGGMPIVMHAEDELAHRPGAIEHI